MSECKHDTSPHPDCLYCCCQAKRGTLQCEDGPNHEGEHWYVGTLDSEFAICWPRCPHAFMPASGLVARCEQEATHEFGNEDTAHTGVSFSGIEFANAAPDDPSNRMITQTVTMQRVQWRSTDGHGA